MWFQMISSARSAVDFDNGDKDEELDDYVIDDYDLIVIFHSV